MTEEEGRALLSWHRNPVSSLQEQSIPTGTIKRKYLYLPAVLILKDLIYNQ